MRPKAQAMLWTEFRPGHDSGCMLTLLVCKDGEWLCYQFSHPLAKYDGNVQREVESRVDLVWEDEIVLHTRVAGPLHVIMEVAREKLCYQSKTLGQGITQRLVEHVHSQLSHDLWW